MFVGRRLRSSIAFALVPLMLSLPVLAVSPEFARAQPAVTPAAPAPVSTSAPTEDACQSGRMAAKARTSGGLWFFVGCVGGLIGLIVAYVYEPNPPAMELIGKSPEHVSSYTGCYRTAAKETQTKNALIGCVVGTTVSIAILVAVAVASFDSYAY